MTKEIPVLTLADSYPFDLTRLMESRLLVTAASGGGKSRLLRRLLEQVAPHVPVIVIDPEGEFHTLREKFEILVCAPSGADAVATPATAPLLARFILEQGISAVFNIYDLKSAERLEFVRILCETLVNARQELWRNVLIVMDEAHIFCPEGGKSEVGQAVIDLATRGRKRGFCLCLATQRLAALDKNAAAQMLNKFIGGNTMKLDIKRAADELGEPLKDMDPKIRALTPGQFYARGPALPAGVQLFKAGPVVTTHPSPGKRFLAPPAPGPKIRALLEDRLKDLPQQAAQEAVTMEQLREQLEESREVVRRLTKQQGQQGIPEAQVQEAIRAARNDGFDIGVGAGMEKAKKLRQGLQDLLDSAHADMDDPNKTLAEMLQDDTPGKAFHLTPEIHRMAINGQGVTLRHKPTAAEHETGGNAYIPERPFTPAVKRDGVSAPQQRILDSLAALMACGIEAPARVILAVQVEASANSSGFQNNLGTLRTMGLIDYPEPGLVELTGEGALAANMPKRPLTLREYRESWSRMVSRPQWAILEALIGLYPEETNRENLAAAVDASPNSSGFQNNLGTLHSMGAITYPTRGHVKASTILFPKGMK